jgi:hypothetical protein
MSSTQTASTGSRPVKSAPADSSHSSPDSLVVAGNSLGKSTEVQLPPQRPTYAATFLHDFGTDAEEDMSNFQCSHCVQLNLGAMIRIPRDFLRKIRYRLLSSKMLWESSQAGCWGCRFFWHVIENDVPHRSIYIKQYSYESYEAYLDRYSESVQRAREITKLSGSMIKVLKQQDLPVYLKIRASVGTPTGSVHLRVRSPPKFLPGTEFSNILDSHFPTKSLKMFFELDICSTKHPHFSIPSRVLSEYRPLILSDMRHPIAPNANDPGCLELIRGWLEQCSAMHKSRCGKIAFEKLPARIIVVPRDLRLPIRLKSTRPGARGRYVTLSHCWGSRIDFVATSANVAALEKEIPFQNLCINFQDAITVTRNLGFRYLWIARIC